jgi:hypothetical protein
MAEDVIPLFLKKPSVELLQGFDLMTPPAPKLRHLHELENLHSK